MKENTDMNSKDISNQPMSPDSLDLPPDVMIILSEPIPPTVFSVAKMMVDSMLANVALIVHVGRKVCSVVKTGIQRDGRK